METESTTAFLAELMDIFLEEGRELNRTLSIFCVFREAAHQPTPAVNIE